MYGSPLFKQLRQLLDTFSSSCILNHIIMSLKSVHDVVHRSSEHRVSRHDTSGSVLYQEGRTSVGKIILIKY